MFCGLRVNWRRPIVTLFWLRKSARMDKRKRKSQAAHGLFTTWIIENDGLIVKSIFGGRISFQIRFINWRSGWINFTRAKIIDMISGRLLFGSGWFIAWGNSDDNNRWLGFIERRRMGRGGVLARVSAFGWIIFFLFEESLLVYYRIDWIDKRNIIWNNILAPVSI